MTNLVTIAFISTALATNWTQLGVTRVGDKHYELSVGRIVTNSVATFQDTNIAPVILKSEPSDRLVLKSEDAVILYYRLTNSTTYLTNWMR